MKINAMVPRHLLQLAVMMALFVLVPCMSYAATPVVVTPNSTITIQQTKDAFSAVMNANARNLAVGFSTTFPSADAANAAITALKQAYPAAATSQNGPQVSVTKISGYSSVSLVDMVTYIYSPDVGGVVNTVTLQYYSNADAVQAASDINNGYVPGYTSATVGTEAPASTNPIGAVIVVRTALNVLDSQAEAFVGNFLSSNAQNGVAGLGAVFGTSTTADNAIITFNTKYPTASTTRSYNAVSVTGIAGFNPEALRGIVEYVYFNNVQGIVTDVTLNFVSQSDADATMTKVNAGNVAGFTSARKQGAPSANVVVVVAAGSSITDVQAEAFVGAFLLGNSQNTVFGLATMPPTSVADALVKALKQYSNAITITQKEGYVIVTGTQQLSTSTLRGLIENVYTTVSNAYNGATFTGLVKEVYLEFGSKAEADAAVVEVNNGNVPGFSAAAEAPAAPAPKDDSSSSPVGAIVGSLVAVAVVGAVIGGVVYWKFFKSKSQDVSSDNNYAMMEDATTTNGDI